MSFPERIRIYEVGAWDGLQNELASIPVGLRVEFVERLVGRGLSDVEAVAFRVPAPGCRRWPARRR